MSVNPNDELPASEVIALLASFLFIMFPPFILFREGPIFLFGNDPLLYLHLYSALGGAICGVALGRKMKIVGLISGIVAAVGGTALFSYYAFYPPAKEFIHTSEILIAIGIGASPGIGFYFLIKKVKN